MAKNGLQFDLSYEKYNHQEIMHSNVQEAIIVKSFFYRYVKRFIDIVIATLGLISLLPLILIVSVLIKATSRGPIFHAMDWVGFRGLPFRGYKFRTMVQNADEIRKTLKDKNEMEGPVFKINNDPRITYIGKLLRKYSIDELPQLWSILKGEMSLIGPRPAMVEEFSLYLPWQKRRLSVIPGLSCLWQVSGRNKISSFDEWAKMDLDYIDNWSLWLDMIIFWKSMWVTLRGTGC
jgi:lipopolysaccharide/colanic/teichoic acid biosynthesis glycosyltransferase